MRGDVLVDTGPIVAALLEPDARHDVCVEGFRQIRGALLTCWPVITEAAWLLRAYPQTIRRLLESLHSGAYTLARLDETDLPGITAILDKYEDLGIQLADASLVHLANREGIDTIFTLDRRDFGVMRLARGRKIRIVP